MAAAIGSREHHALRSHVFDPRENAVRALGEVVAYEVDGLQSDLAAGGRGGDFPDKFPGGSRLFDAPEFGSMRLRSPSVCRSSKTVERERIRAWSRSLPTSGKVDPAAGPRGELIVSLRIKTVLAVLVALGLLWAYQTREQQAQDRLASERSPFAPTEVVDMGRMPTELRESSGLGVSQ